MRPAGAICRGGARGFTLLEVLLAFVVFALSFAVVLEILSGSLRNTVRAREHTEAALMAQSVMDQVGLEFPLEAGATASGETGIYRWELNVYEFAGGPENARSLEVAEQTGLQLLEIEFLVSWGEGRRERTSRFSTVKAVLPVPEEGA